MKAEIKMMVAHVYPYQSLSLCGQIINLPMSFSPPFFLNNDNPWEDFA